MDTNDDDDTAADEQFFADIAAYLETQQEPLLLLALSTSSDGTSTDCADPQYEDEPALSLGATAVDRSSDRNSVLTLPQQQQQQQQHSRPQARPSAQPPAAALATPRPAPALAPAPARAPARAATPRRPPRVRNASRERMQRELKQLRTQSSELALQLAALRARASSSSSSHERLLLAAWASTAKRQLELRTLAELENARLKQQLERHTALMDTLQTALGCAQSTAVVQPPCVSPSAVRIRPEDVALCTQLLAELDGAWTRMDRELDASHIGSLRRFHGARSLQPFSHASVRSRRDVASRCSTDALAQFIELTSAETMPFAHEAVFRVNWECWERQGDARGQVKIEHVPLGVNAHVVELAMSLQGVRVPMRILHVARAYREAHRVSYVWRSVTSAASRFPGVVVDETGWQTMATTTATDADSARGHSVSTEILTCVHIESRATSDERASAQVLRVSPLANLVISVVDAEELQVHDMMRRMLLQDARAQRGAGGAVTQEASV